MTRPSRSAGPHGALVGLVIGLALALVANAGPIASMVAIWRGHEAYAYGWLVVPALLYVLAWHDRDATLSLMPVPTPAAWPAAVVAALCAAAGQLAGIDALRHIALVLAVHAVCLAGLGVAAYRQLFPALLLLLLAVPAGDLLLRALRALTVLDIVALARLAGWPLQVDGYTLTIGTHAYVVLDECAGLSHFLLATFLGHVFGLLLFRRLGPVLAMAALGALLGLLSNALRVWAIVLINRATGTRMPLSGHVDLQWVALVVVLGVLFVVVMLIDARRGRAVRVAGSGAPVTAPGGADGSDAPAGLIHAWPAGVAGLIIALGTLGTDAWLARAPAPQVAATTVLPPRIGPWERQAGDVPFARWGTAAPGVAQALYRRGDAWLLVRLASAAGPSTKLTGREVAPGADFFGHDASAQEACAGANCVRWQHTLWVSDAPARQQHLYALFAVAGQWTGSRLHMRTLQALQRLRGRSDAVWLLGCASEAPLDAQVLGELLEGLAALRPGLP